MPSRSARTVGALKAVGSIRETAMPSARSSIARSIARTISAMLLETDPVQARAIGRPYVQNPYLGLTNYLSSLRRLGWTDADFADGGSDALIDALVVHGDAPAIARGIAAHLDAGADHVAVQALNPDPLPALRALADGLQLARG